MASAKASKPTVALTSFYRIPWPIPGVLTSLDAPH